MVADSAACGFIGQLRLDHYVSSDGHAHDAVAGGGALYAAVGAALWQSVQPYLIAPLPPDFPASTLSEIERCGIDTRYLRAAASGDPRTFFAYEPSGERRQAEPTRHYLRARQPLPKDLLGLSASHLRSSTVSVSDALEPLSPERLPASTSKLEAIHLAASSLVEQLTVPPRLRQLGIEFISMDPASVDMAPDRMRDQSSAVHGLDAFLPSLTQSRRLFRDNARSIWQMAREFTGFGCPLVVIKRGPEGQILYDGESDCGWIVPAYPSRVHDITGAGHAFCGGFLAGMVMTGDPLEACLMGNVSASIVLEGSGPKFAVEATPGLPEARLERLRPFVRRA